MHIELPQSHASSADLYPDLDDGSEDVQTVTLERRGSGAQAIARIRVAPARGHSQTVLRFSVQAPEGSDGTFTNG